MRSWVVGLLAATGLAAAVPSVAQDNGQPVFTTSFGDWIVGCDNTRACSAVALSGGDERGFGPHLFLTREGAYGALPHIEFGLGYGDGADGVGDRVVIDIAIDGPHAAHFSAVTRKPDQFDAALELRSADTNCFLLAVRDGATITLSHSGGRIGAISLTGSSAAMRWIDDRQKRAGTTTAIVARGPAPGSAVPAPPAEPVVALAPAASQARLPSLPAVIANREDVRACAEEYDEEDPHRPYVARLSGSEYLWQVPCGMGAYNYTTLYIIARADGSGQRSPDFWPDHPDWSSNGPDTLINGQYDPKTRLLAAFSKGRGLGDCGDDAAWAWDGHAFRLTHHAVMETCMGVVSNHWIRVWRARTR
jgi:hypothetical protein